MLGLFQLLFYGHIHKWKVIRQVQLSSDIGAVGTRTVLQCETCGNVKKKDLI